MRRIRQWTVLEPTADGRPGVDVIERDGTTKFGRDGGLVNIADPRILLLPDSGRHGSERRAYIDRLIAEDRIVMDQAVLVPATVAEVAT